MAEPTRSRTYTYLAEYYDLFFGSFDGARDAARQAVVGPILPQVRSACDLACGSGTTAVTFARAGIQTIAVDLAPGMCRLVRRKARSAGVAVRVIRADMREFRLPRQVDLVTCEADAINHVERKEDLAAVVRSVARALRPGGWFYFDVTHRAGFENAWTGTWWAEKPGVVMVMRNGNDARHDRAWSDVEWFVREAGGTWRRRRARVQEVCWSAREVRSILRGAGFDRVLARDASPYYRNPVITPGCRSLFLARRTRPSGPHVSRRR